MHDNPRRKGLVTDVVVWCFSSVGYWLGELRGETDVVLSLVRHKRIVVLMDGLLPEVWEFG